MTDIARAFICCAGMWICIYYGDIIGTLVAGVGSYYFSVEAEKERG